jgi:AbrB family looped-hinge helix DNA binding protein
MTRVYLEWGSVTEILWQRIAPNSNAECQESRLNTSPSSIGYNFAEQYEKCDLLENVATVSCGGNFFGSVTVGERGQIVIPAEARAEMQIVPGDKLLVLRHPVHQGLIITKFEAMKEFLEELDQKLGEVREHIEEGK